MGTEALLTPTGRWENVLMLQLMEAEWFYSGLYFRLIDHRSYTPTSSADAEHPSNRQLQQSRLCSSIGVGDVEGKITSYYHSLGKITSYYPGKIPGKITSYYHSLHK
ncbi:hypothetical protein RvY_13631 [Ramazzottius varieornatus]|uniref:Uncharacterized protein n=1 Tax=Ramazzottius varieornatus TaxID=947166 RepID=A0A1D1VSK7_RAMVA|nr:hypothetical protein RvY_13631 [Ramazzottius varieornatus]